VVRLSQTLWGVPVSDDFRTIETSVKVWSWEAYQFDGEDSKPGVVEGC